MFKKLRSIVMVILILAIIGAFLPDEDEGYGVSGYGNAFAPPSLQGSSSSGQTGTSSSSGSSSQFSDAIDQLLAGKGSFSNSSGLVTAVSGGGAGGISGLAGSYSDSSYEQIYSEVMQWADDEWDIFFDFMYEYFGHEAVAILLDMDRQQLLHTTVEIMLVLYEGM